MLTCTVSFMGAFLRFHLFLDLFVGLHISNFLWMVVSRCMRSKPPSICTKIGDYTKSGILLWPVRGLGCEVILTPTVLYGSLLPLEVVRINPLIKISALKLSPNMILHPVSCWRQL